MSAGDKASPSPTVWRTKQEMSGVLQKAAVDDAAVVQPGVLRHVRQGSAIPGLGIRAPENDPGEPGVDRPDPLAGRVGSLAAGEDAEQEDLGLGQLVAERLDDRGDAVGDELRRPGGRRLRHGAGGTREEKAPGGAGRRLAPPFERGPCGARRSDRRRGRRGDHASSSTAGPHAGGAARSPAP